MAEQLIGSAVSLRAGFETTFGTPATTMYEFAFAPTLTLNTEQALNESSVMNGNRSATQGFLGFKDGKGSLIVPCDSKSIGFWFKAFFNSPTTANNGDGTYTHTFTVNNTDIPSMTLETAHLDKANTFYRHVGFKANNFSISLGGDDELLINMELVGKDSSKEATQVATPNTSLKDGTKFQKFNNVISSLTGADTVETYTISYSNNLKTDSYTVNGGSSRNSISLGQTSVTGDITAQFTGDSLATSIENFTVEGITSTLTQGTDILQIDTNEVNFGKIVGSPEIGSPQGIPISTNYVAFHKNGATASSIIITLTNDVASYA